MKINRRQAREVAMQMLYQCDLNPDTSVDDVQQFVTGRLHFKGLEEFCLSLIEGVRRQLPRIDDLLLASAENWTVRRMAPVDRNILRLATYELRFADNAVPPKVAINEALEICKRYSSADSVAFVNGVLDKIAGLREREPAATLDAAEQ